MKIKMSNALDILAVYRKIKDQVMPISITYKLARLFNSFQEASEFYSAELSKIIDRYSEKDAGGHPIPLDYGSGVKIQQEYLVEAQEKLNELLRLEVDVPDITFTLQELEPVQLSLDEFNQLLPFIQD